MTTNAIVKEVTIEEGNRVVKVVELGPKTAEQIAPFGDDSSPLNDTAGIFSKTTERGDSVIIGYFNGQQIAQPGEKRIFSLNTDGSLSFNIHLKGDGTCEINGTGNFLVKFNELKTAFDQLVKDHNALLADYKAHVHTTTATVGSSPTPGTITAPTVTLTDSTASVDNAKAENIKTA